MPTISSLSRANFVFLVCNKCQFQKIRDSTMVPCDHILCFVEFLLVVKMRLKVISCSVCALIILVRDSSDAMNM